MQLTTMIFTILIWVTLAGANANIMKIIKNQEILLKLKLKD